MTDRSPLTGGTFGSLTRFRLKDGTELVAKTAKGASTLALEGWMLRCLRDRSDLPVPDVLHADDTLLLMTCLPSDGAITDTAQIHAAELIAALHNVRGEAFGLDRDTVIGPLPQPNDPSTDWIPFLRDRRLLPMGRAAHDAGSLDGDTLSRLETFCGRLETYVEEPAHPSLLHGDLWTGNVLAQDGRISGFIDPAIYFGDPEMDLAFSILFGTFGEPFLDRYAEIRPLKRGFLEERRDICNLWPILVDARLFGPSYGHQAAQILARFI